MASFVKTAGLLFLALGVVAVLLATPDEVSFYQKFIYCWFYILVFGWLLYVPFAVGYAALARRWQMSGWLSTVVGAGLAVVAAAPVWASRYFVFSGQPLFDAACWAGGGACYGLLHHLLVSRYHEQPA